eukprot:SAG31_NODE_29768_length_390_cov_0.711340_1_plen_34_part_01
MQQCLQATLDPDRTTRLGAEAFLAEHAGAQGFGL